jgi:chromosome partitioning protein
MAIIAVAGRKGGIGKSTIVGNLAAEFVAMGYSVIALDADPQHSLAAWAALGEGMLAGCVEKVNAAGAETLRARAREAQKEADIVLIDTPPGTPAVAHQAALAADLMLLPCGPSPLDLLALKDALKARAERRSKRPRIRFVPSKVLANTNLGKSLHSSLNDLGKKVLPSIGQRVAVAEAVADGLTVREYAPGSAAHEEFRKLAKAVDKIASHS